MGREFGRNPIYPALLLLPAILFGITTVLQFATGSPAAFLTLMASALFFVNAIWSFSTPLIRIEGYKIFFKEALLKQKEIVVSSIQKIESPKEKILQLHQHDGSVLKMRLDMLKKDDRDTFKRILTDLHQESSGENEDGSAVN